MFHGAHHVNGLWYRGVQWLILAAGKNKRIMEKLGLVPIGKVPVVNLQTLETTVLDFIQPI
jgi:hypothetical protein